MPKILLPGVSATDDGNGLWAFGASYWADYPAVSPSWATGAAAPVSVTAALTQVLYLQEPGDAAAISVNDIHQGQMGDCFLMSSIGELAMLAPNAINNMIAVNANGTETVTLWLAASGGLPTFGTTAFTPTTITVSNSFPSNSANCGATDDVVGGQKEIWVQVLEKAVATLGGGYGSIANGGNPVIALEELTGLAASWMSPGALTLSQLQADAAAGDLIVFDTGYNNVGYGLYNSHAYMFVGLTTVGGAPAVQLRNPWGFDDPSPIPFSQLASQFAEIDVGQAPATSGPPTLSVQTPDQTWTQGAHVSLALAASTFFDPQHLALTYSAAQVDGQALPSWLSFNAATRVFAGTVPAGMQTLSLSVTATDTAAGSASETFQVTVPAAAPKLAHATSSQTWTEGAQLSLALPANAFVDPQNQALSYAATLSNGQPLPSWLSCDPSTGTFNGTVPYASSVLSIKLTAADTSGLSAYEVFAASVVAPAPTVTDRTPNQAWVAGSAVSLVLASDTFTAVPGQTLSYTAVLPAGLSFNAATETIAGTAPLLPGTYTISVIATQTSRLSAYETFQAVVTASAPTVTNQTAGQAWTAGQAVSLPLAADTFTDPQGQKLTYAVSGVPAGLVFNPTTMIFSGQATFIPGTYTIRVAATDASRLSTYETFQAVVTASAPTVTNQTAGQAWTAGQAVSLPLAADTFTDPQGQKLTYTVSGVPAGLVFNPTTMIFSGQATFIPGTYTIRVAATDASRLSTYETFQAVVTASAPTVTNQTADQAWTAGQAVSLPLAADTFTDPQGQKLTYTVSGVPAGLVFNPTTMTFSGHATFIPGTYTIRVAATDASRLSTYETFQAAVTASAPTVTSQTADQAWTAWQTVSLPLAADTFTDPQGETLTWSVTGVPSGLVFSPATHTFSGHAPVIPGNYTIKVTATDSSRLAASETFQAVVTASAPMVTDQSANQAWTAYQTVTLPLAADTFTDPQGEALAWSVTGVPSGLAFNPATHLFSGRAPVAAGNYTIKVTATDTSRLSVSETFQAVVTASAPTVTDQTADQAWTAGQRLSFVFAPDTFTDPQAETLTWKATQANGQALPAGMTLNASTHGFIGTVPLATGTYSLLVTATDTSGLSASETFNAVVSASAPTVTQTPDQSWTAGRAVSLTPSFIDPQGEKLTYRAAQWDGSALPKGLAFNTLTGAFSGTPTVPGNYALSVSAANGSGLSASETFNAVVQPAAPAAHATPNLVWTDLQAVKFMVPTGAFTDPQASPLTYAAYEVGGDDQTSWLHFSPSPADFFGTVPAGLSGTIGIELVATNGYGLSASETFGLTFAAVGAHVAAVPFTSAPSELLPLPN